MSEDQAVAVDQLPLIKSLAAPLQEILLHLPSIRAAAAWAITSPSSCHFQHHRPRDQYGFLRRILSNQPTGELSSDGPETIRATCEGCRFDARIAPRSGRRRLQPGKKPSDPYRIGSSTKLTLALARRPNMHGTSWNVDAQEQTCSRSFGFPSAARTGTPSLGTRRSYRFTPDFCSCISETSRSTASITISGRSLDI